MVVASAPLFSSIAGVLGSMICSSLGLLISITEAVAGREEERCLSALTALIILSLSPILAIPISFNSV
jgi:predicted regulator of Ras-like GTPase activity (Roadblock/LC7/MglB family)